MPAQKPKLEDPVSLVTSERVSLRSLSELTGFPIELLQKELLLQGKLGEDGSLSMSDLREAMMTYLDKTLLETKDASVEH